VLLPGSLSGHSIKNYGRLEYRTLEWIWINNTTFDITFLFLVTRLTSLANNTYIHTYTSPRTFGLWFNGFIAGKILKEKCMSFFPRMSSWSSLLSCSFYNDLALNELVLSNETNIIDAACIECMYSIKAIHFAYNLWLTRVLKADEIIVCFNDAMAYRDDIKPDILYWRWAVTPILQPKKRPGAKGKRTNAVGSYKIMVRVPSLSSIQLSIHHTFVHWQACINVCPICEKAYNPDRDIQRFCRFCKTWHHLFCLKDQLPPLPGPHGIPTLVLEHSHIKGKWPYMDSFLRILHKPIQRGKDDGIVGNGLDSESAWEVYDSIQRSGRGPTQKQWECMNVSVDSQKEFRSEVMGLLEVAAPTYYDCPTCHSRGGHGFL